MNKTELIEFVKNKCAENGGHKLLYISKVGSYLYGTNGPDSDEDYRFIFLPNRRFLLVGNNIKHITYTSGNDKSKNTKNDVDIQGWSLQYFIELIGKGETNAVDLLFSPSNKDAVVYSDVGMIDLFIYPEYFIDPSNVKGYLGFANGQAEKYSIKGKKLKIVKDIDTDEYLNKAQCKMIVQKLEKFKDYIVEKYVDGKFCCLEKDDRGMEFLKIGESRHMFSISLEEFMKRIHKEVLKYGERAKKAMIADGNDYKALCNAYRCYIQYISLMKTGKIIFPFEPEISKIIKDIKYGRYSPDYIKEIIKNVMEEVNNIECFVQNKKDKKYIDNFILNYY